MNFLKKCRLDHFAKTFKLKQTLIVFFEPKIWTNLRGLFLVATFSFAFQMTSWTQVYVEKQTRHRFAQLNFGLDLQTNFGGHSNYLDSQGRIQSLEIPSLTKARLLIGGTHFWGHADFYIAIPVSFPKALTEKQEINFSSGVETVFKYYPLRITHRKFRPFIGIAISPFYFEQTNQNLSFGNGPELQHTSFPLLAGFSYNHGAHLFEFGASWNYDAKQDYHISRTTQAEVQTPALYASISYRYMLETTLSAEADWESGRTAAITQKLAEKRKLNGFFLGAGMSSAWWLGHSSYNQTQRPYVEKFGVSVMGDFVLGYYLHQPDLNFSLSYRAYKTQTNTYGSIQTPRRTSFAVEVTKNLFDYHGFTPFAGPVVSYEKLSFVETFEGKELHNLQKNKIGFGINFGWDIRPNRIQSFLLRTNLRYFPNLQLELNDGQQISFNNIEFNFIQLILFPSRIF